MDDKAVNVFDLNSILPSTFQATPIQAPTGSFDYSILFQSQFQSPIKSPTIHEKLEKIIWDQYETVEKSKQVIKQNIEKVLLLFDK